MREVEIPRARPAGETKHAAEKVLDVAERRAAQIFLTSNRRQHLLALEGPELAQRSVSIRFYVTLPNVAVAKKSGPTLLSFRVGQIHGFHESVQAHRALRNQHAIVERP